jgi:hypothetical protein
MQTYYSQIKLDLSRIKLLLVVVSLFAVLSFILIGATVRFISDRQPANIKDIPVYSGASSIDYNYNPTIAPADASGCTELTFTSSASEESVHDFYKKTLINDDIILKNGWVGDGLFYPQTHSVSFYRKAGGIMQRVRLTTAPAGGKTLATIYLCNLE